jgi:hypothetical protein
MGLMGKKTVLVAAAALCCAFLSCEGDKDSLSWYSTVDIPVNIELRVWQGVEYLLDNSAADSVIVDMSKSSFAIEEVFLIKKLREPTVEYKINMANKYKNLNFVFYAIFAPKSYGMNIEEMNIQDVYYNLIMSENSENNMNYVSIFGRDGFKVEAGDKRDTTVELSNDGLVHRVLSSPSISWRWLAKISRNDYDESVKPDNAQMIDTRFRLRVRGISNMDSLFTL